MRREDLYLCDIVEAADAIARFLSGYAFEQFSGDDLLRSAVLQKLMIIGEAAARLSDSVKAKRPEIPWQDIVGFRNIAVHAYFAVDWQIVWIAATVNAPMLRDSVIRFLEEEYPEGYRALMLRQ